MTNDIFFLPFDNNTIVANEWADRLTILDERAAMIAQHLSANTSLPEIIKLLIDTKHVSKECAQKEVENFSKEWELFLSELRDNQLTDPDIIESKDDNPHPNLHSANNFIEHSYIISMSGMLFGIDLDNETLLSPIETALGILRQRTDDTPLDFLFEVGQDDNGYHLHYKGSNLQYFKTLDEFLITLRLAVSHLICTHTLSIAWMHAGAVMARGQALLFAGQGGSGKTTLVAYLASNGYKYLSEDVTPLSIGNPPMIKAIPLPLSIKAGSWPALLPHYPKLERLPSYKGIRSEIKFLPINHSPTQENYPVQSIIFPNYSKDAEGSLKEVTPTDALARVTSSDSIFTRPLTRQQLKQFLGWLEQTPAYDLHYSNLAEAHLLIKKIPV